MINQRTIWNFRCGLIHEGATFDDTQWENLIQMEVERFVLKEIFLSKNLEGEIAIWKTLIEEYDPETKIAKIKNLFE